MKTRYGCLAVLLISLILLSSAHGENMPSPVHEYYFKYGKLESEVADTLSIRDGNGNEWFFIADRFGGLDGYILINDEWKCYESGMRLFRAEDTQFERGGIDETGFTVTSESRDAWMTYDTQGEGFYLSSWRDGEAWPGMAEITENAVIFYPDGGGEPIEIPIGKELKSWLNDFEYMPKTPEEVRLRASNGKDILAEQNPGWTMDCYEMYNIGERAEAAFYRVEDGKLTVRWASASVGEEMKTMDSLPVPLSEGFLSRMETEPMENLIDCSGYGSTFLTEDNWDHDMIPIEGKMIENDLQQHALVVLTEREDGRYLSVAEMDGAGNWQVREAGPLPKDFSMDIFHGGNDYLLFEWDQQECCCEYRRTLSGDWVLEYASDWNSNYQPRWYGVEAYDENGDTSFAYGTFPYRDLFQLNVEFLPVTADDAREITDSDGWAAVKNPNSADRLHLRAKPYRNSDSLGKFYNGTPLRVLEKRGDWCRVRIGEGQALEGWMMTKYLELGDAWTPKLKNVEQAFPDLFVHDEVMGQFLFSDLKEHISSTPIDNFVQIIGVVDEKQWYVIMTRDGDIGYAPQNWFWEGNG
ncbi:MAG: SH3 domain-containing protein [Clostridia bacterium]|nr:SH3 domain-containing protein [Clostridia bacterium]